MSVERMFCMVYAIGFEIAQTEMEIWSSDELHDHELSKHRHSS